MFLPKDLDRTRTHHLFTENLLISKYHKINKIACIQAFNDQMNSLQEKNQ